MNMSVLLKQEQNNSLMTNLTEIDIKILLTVWDSLKPFVVDLCEFVLGLFGKLDVHQQPNV